MGKKDLEVKNKEEKQHIKQEKKQENKQENKLQNSESKTLCSMINMYLYFVVAVMPFLLIKFGSRYYVDAKVVSLFYVGIVIFNLIAISRKTQIRIEHKIALGFLFTICLAAIFSSYPGTVILGSVERREGLAMYFVYIILFIAASNFLEVTQKSIYIILSAASLMSVYTVIQMFGIDPIQVSLYGKIVTPTTSIATIGNSNFVSSYLCMFIFLAMGLFILKKKYIYLGFSTVIFLGLLAAKTRGGWITFAVVSVIGLVLIIKKKDCLIRAGIMVLVFIVAFFGLNYFSDNQITDRAKLSNIFKTEESTQESTGEQNTESDNSNESNVTSASNKEGDTEDVELVGSASSRMHILEVAFKVFKNRPLLGEGPDTLGLTIKDNYNEDYKIHASKYNEGMDKAHNEYLEYAASDGIFTVLLYLALVGMIVFKLFKNIKSDKVKIVLLAVLAYLVQAAVNISVIMVAPLFWILLGYAVKMIYDEKFRIEGEI